MKKLFIEPSPSCSWSAWFIYNSNVTSFPKESDMQVINGTVKLKLQEGSHGIVVKNLYLSYDPYMCIRMTRVEGPNVFTSYTPGSVSSLSLSLLLSWFCYHYVRNHCRQMDNNCSCYNKWINCPSPFKRIDNLIRY